MDPIYQARAELMPGEHAGDEILEAWVKHYEALETPEVIGFMSLSSINSVQSYLIWRQPLKSKRIHYCVHP